MRKSILVIPRWAAAVAIASAMTFAPAVSFAETWVADSALGTGAVEAPAKDDVLPNDCQYTYAKEELAAFCHFGPNTIANIEWGEHYGTTHNGVTWKTATEYMNELKSFDAAEYVKTIKDAGFKRLIVTAKHHDGFRMWDSASSEYDMASTTSRIDVLAKISEECTRQGLDMGLYLSPWDINDPTYGKGECKDSCSKPCKEDHNGDYNDSYVKQLEEILGNPKYGRDGKFVEIWMDGAKGSGGGYQEYDFDKYYEVIKKHEGASCLAFQCGEQGEARWVGNEDGVAHDTTWNRVEMRENWDQSVHNQPFVQNKTTDPSTGKSVIVGKPDGTKWFMPECDARITSGWFWGPSKAAPKPLTELGTMYFMSVGRGAPLLLNVPLDTKGNITPEIKKRVEEFGASIRAGFADDLTRANPEKNRAAATAEATSVHQNNAAYGPGKMLDGNDATYWSANAAGKQSVLIKLPAVTQFDVVSIEEAIQNGQRIQSFKVMYRNGSGAWTEFGAGGTIGAKRLVRAPKVTATEVKIELTPLAGKVVQLSEVGLFKMDRSLEAPSAIPEGMESLDNTKMTLGNEADWTKNGGSQFVDGTNMFSKKKGATATFKFTGSKFLVIGTADPNHGPMKVTIDNKAAEAQTINTAAPRKTGQVLYTSPTLDPGEHTVKIEVLEEGKAVAVDAAAILNNGGVGMLDFAEPVITMDEDSTYDLGIKRTGGSMGELEVVVNFEPDTAVQGDFHTDPVRVKFASGETEKTVQVRTKRNNTGVNAAVNTQFSVSMTVVSPNNLVVGPQGITTVNIIDRDSNYTKEKLGEALKRAEATSVNEGSHAAASASAYRAALVNARALLADEAAGVDQYFYAIKALDAAIANPEIRTEKYTSENPFVFPDIVGETQTIEAELGELKDDPSSNGSGDKKYPAEVKDIEGASGGKVVNSLNEKDTLSIPFVVERAGEYEVTLRYMSGSTGNKISWGAAVAAGSGVTASESEDLDVPKTEGLHAQDAGALGEGGAPVVSGAGVISDEDGASTVDGAADDGRGAASAAAGAEAAQGAEGEDVLTSAPAEDPAVPGSSARGDVMIDAGEQAAGGTDQTKFQTMTFTLKVKKPGVSMLVFTGPAGNSPRIDKLDIKLKGDSLKEFGIVALAGTGGRIDPAGFMRPGSSAQSFTVTPGEGYRVRAVSVDGRAIEVADPYAALTFEVPLVADATRDLDVRAIFDKKLVMPATPIEPAPAPEPGPVPNPDPSPNPDSIPNPGQGGGQAGAEAPDSQAGSLPATGDPASIAMAAASASVAVLGIGVFSKRRSRRL
ncbi:MAG: alpha-L-fucosidase [Collinsella intestinalis]